MLPWTCRYSLLVRKTASHARTGCSAEGDYAGRGPRLGGSEIAIGAAYLSDRNVERRRSRRTWRVRGVHVQDADDIRYMILPARPPDLSYEI